MASIQGTTKLQWLTFGEAHDTVWQTASTTIGITEPQGDAYVAKVTAARTKFDAMVAARQAARNAIQDWYTAAQAMHEDAAMLLGLIKGYANSQADPNAVYTLAQIPPPAVPQPAGPPVDCTALTADLTNFGNVELNWKGTLANGQYFSVWRQLSGEANFSMIGTVRAKTYLDEDFSGASKTSASYIVRAHRGTQVSQGCEAVTILFIPAQEPVVLELAA